MTKKEIERARDLAAIFRNVASQGHKGDLKKFAKLHKSLVSFAHKERHKNLWELGRGDFIVKGDEDPIAVVVRVEVESHFRLIYCDSRKSLNSQLCLLRTLGRKDSEIALKEETTAEPVDPIDPERLPEHIKAIWLAIPRQGAWQDAGRKPRQELPLTKYGRDVLTVILKVHNKFQTTSAAELLVERYCDIKHEVMKLNHTVRYKVLEMFTPIRRKLDLSLNSGPSAVKEDDLPPDIRAWLANAVERAQEGFQAFPDLMEMAKDYEVEHVTPYAGSSIRSRRTNFLMGIAYADLTPESTFPELLRLEPKSVIVKGREVTKYYNPEVEKYLSAERNKVRPGYKKVGFDSRSGCHYIQAVSFIARFNGRFAEAEALSEAYRSELKYDKDSKSDRKDDKLTKIDPTWLDGQIERLYPLYKAAIKKRSYLTIKADLELCLFYPELLTFRYLGLRQQCERKCDLGKHVVFLKDGSIVWHYEKGEIKNRRQIHQVFSMKRHKGFKVIERIIDVWKCHKGLLDSIKSLDPARYKKNVGAAFFVKTKRNFEDGLIERYKRGEPGQDVLESASRDLSGTIALNTVFEKNLYRFLDCSPIRGCPYNLNVHFLRAVCCNWMIKVLKWTWEQVAKALGDNAETLKQEYYHEEEYVVDASDAFAETARQMLGQQHLFSTMGVDSGGASESVVSMYTRSVDLIEDQFKRERERADRYEQEAIESRGRIRVLEAQLAAMNQPRPVAFA